MAHTRIVILGGGYSGMMTARRLARKVDELQAEIVLISDSDRFVERIRNHQLAANQALRHLSIQNIFDGKHVKFIHGRVTQIIPDSRSVVVQTAQEIQTMPYDYLVYALGSFIDGSTVPGTAEYTASLSTAEASRKLRDLAPAIAANGRRLVICGGGLTGIESATELAEAYPTLQVTLITRRPFGAELSRLGQRHLRRVFDRLHIQIIDNANIIRISASQVEYDGGIQPFDLCVWAAGFAVPTLAREAGLKVNARGQVLVDNHLRSISHPTIYAVGDAADVSDAIHTPIRMACATAIPMGSYVADELAATLQRQIHHPFEFAYTFRCISLGRRDGLIQFVDADDRPRERIFTGWLAVQIKEMVCRYAVWQIQNDRLVYHPRRPASERRAAQKHIAASS